MAFVVEACRARTGKTFKIAALALTAIAALPPATWSSRAHAGPHTLHPRPPHAVSPVVRVSAACSHAYHAALSRIAQDRIAPATQALTATRRAAEAGLPGRWMFGPYTRSGRGGPRPVAGEQVIETIERTVCVRPAKEEAKDQGGGCLREERRKTQKQVVLDPLAAPTAERPRHVARQEQALYFMADGLVKSAGQVLNLQAETQNGAIARRVARELAGYTGQALHPALCTGMPELLEHHERQSSPLKRQVQTYRQAAQTGHELAALRVFALRDLVRKGHAAVAQASSSPPAPQPAAAAAAALDPAAPATPLVTGAILTGATVAPAGTGVPMPPLTDLIATAASIALGAPDAADVAAQSTPLGALRALAIAHKARAMTVQPETVRDALDETLGVLEAAAYVAHAGHLHAQIGDGLIGGMTAIRAAHAQACTCPDKP